MTNQSRNLANLIMSRRTIHNFVPDKVPDISLIKEAIEIACWAPNHHLTEPWRFYLLGSETITSVCDLNKKILTASSSSDAAQKKYLRLCGVLLCDTKFHALSLEQWYWDKMVNWRYHKR